MYSVFVGIDVFKDFFSAAGIDSEGNKCFSKSYSMDSNGFRKLLNAIPSHDEDFSKVLMAMESTGCYHINSLFLFHIPGDPVLPKLTRHSLTLQ